jgi:predicted NodU family carbamoyl transferase
MSANGTKQTYYDRATVFAQLGVFREPVGCGSEVGPRALGNRSILADPRDVAIKDRINSRVKHRAWFRPFAPASLEERVAEFFDIDQFDPL